jgi:hypothetical protein
MRTAFAVLLGSMLLLLGLYLADHWGSERIFTSIPEPGYSALFVELYGVSKADSDKVMERMNGITGDIYDRPSLVYSIPTKIGNQRTRIRINRKVSDLGSEQFAYFDEWVRDGNIPGKYKIIFYDDGKIIRSFTRHMTKNKSGNPHIKY